MAASADLPVHVQDHGWVIMDHWQQLIESRPDDEAVHSLLILLVDVWLSQLHYTHETTTAQTLLFFSHDLMPRIATYFLEREQAADTTEDA